MDVREHPDYAEGYEARWYNRRASASASAEYMAGYEAAQRAQEIFSDAGMTQTAPGLWTKETIIKRKTPATCQGSGRRIMPREAGPTENPA